MALIEQPSQPVSIFPDDDEVVSASTLLAQAETLLAGDYETDDLVVSEGEAPPLGAAPAFDFSTNRWITGGGYGPLMTREDRTLSFWIEKCLRTDRGAHPVHPDGYGMIRPFDLIGMPMDDLPLTDLFDRIRDALTFHPRIVDVTDFEADYDPDAEHIDVSFIVRREDETTAPIEIRLP